MLQSQLFTKTRREAPKDEVAKNAQLLIRAGFINKEMAGVYSYLPLGLRVLKKIENIIREEMSEIGGQEIFMTTLQDPDVWKRSGRWDDAVMDNWFKSQLKNGEEVGIANTHEEPLSNLLTQHVNSYKDLPLYIYQFQTKFRNELRAKSGIMRGREFMMKDLYSFSRTEEEFKEFYEQVADAYLKIFDRVGLGALTYRTAAAGGSFTDGLTDEFQTISDAGEDTIYIDEKKKLAINKEVYNDEVIAQLGLDKDSLQEKKAIEVGNIFPLGTKYSEVFKLRYVDDAGNQQPIIMGSYGIGLGRVMGTIVESFASDKGIVWPSSVSPFLIHLVLLKSDDGNVKKKADELYKKLTDKGIEVLYDDRSLQAGEKFADSDLIGISHRAIISAKTIEKGSVELVNRQSGNAEMVSEDALFSLS